MQIQDSTVVRSTERPNCWACRDRGWTFIGDDYSLPIRRTCARCTGLPARDLAFWGMVPTEVPAGDVDEFGVYVDDAA